MTDKQSKKGVTRRVFLKGTATMAAAGGLITRAPVLSNANAQPQQKKNPIFFKEIPEILGMMPEDVAQNMLVSNWPSNPLSNTVIEFIHVDKAGTGMGTGFKMNMSGTDKPGPITPKGEYSDALRLNSGPLAGSWPYRSTMNTMYLWASLDPKRPDYVDLEMETWQGEMDECEQYLQTTPGAWVVQRARLHGPHFFRKVGTPMLWTVILGGPNNNMEQMIGQQPKDFVRDKFVKQQWPKDKPRKYAKDFIVIDPKQVTVPPSHKGKVIPIMFIDFLSHYEIDRTVDERIILEAGVGFGIGESSGDGLYDFYQWPQKHHFTETYIFCPMDPNDKVLGAEVEFWVGEDENAEKYTITKKTIITIPPNIYHFPMVVRKLDKPFIFATISEKALWCAHHKCSMPPGFKL